MGVEIEPTTLYIAHYASDSGEPLAFEAVNFSSATVTTTNVQRC